MHYKLFSNETIFPEIDPLSIDHKPENPDEKLRIENAGFILKKDSDCFRIYKS